MSLEFECGQCGKSFSVPEKFAGKQSRCKQCGAVFIIPHPQPAAEVPPPQNISTRLDKQTSLLEEAAVEDAATSRVLGDPFQSGPASPLTPLGPPKRRSGLPPVAWVGIGSGCLVLLLIVGFVVMLAGSSPEGEPPSRPSSRSQELAQRPPEPSERPSPPPTTPFDISSGSPFPDQSSKSPSDPSASPEKGDEENPFKNPFKAVTPDDPSQSSVTLPPTDKAPVVPAPPALKIVTLSQFRYRWQTDRQYAYEYSIEMKLEDETLRVTGMNLITPKSSSPYLSKMETKHGSGTGFVVSSDGYLVSCAHVVEGATDVEVVLNDIEYKGRVIALDKKNDLALLRINATDLPVLALADSEAVQLAQEVRAVGYPISDIVGESVKVTRGSIAGILDDNTAGKGKLFQVDASLNPGNSGGPVVNEIGEVVGVASAKIVLDEVTNVGFAVPINEARSLVDQHGVSFTPGHGGDKLDGPQLAQKVRPSVAFIRVTVAARGFAKGDTVALETVRSTTHTLTKGSSQPSSSPTRKETSHLVVDQYGGIIEEDGRAKSGFGSGAVENMFFVGLSPTGETHWEEEEQKAIQIAKEPSSGLNSYLNRNRLESRFRSQAPAPSQESAVSIPIVEKVVYDVKQQSDGKYLIRVQYDLSSLQKPGDPPLMQIKGEGKTLFDKQAGIPLRTEYNGSINANVGGKKLQIPLKVSYWRTEPTAVVMKLDKIQEAPKDGMPGELSEDDLNVVLEALREPYLARIDRLNLLKALWDMTPIDDRREDVYHVLQPLTEEPGGNSVSREAFRALSKWGTDQRVVSMAGKLDKFDAFGRAEVIRRLGEIKTREAAEGLVLVLAKKYQRHGWHTHKDLSEDLIVSTLVDFGAVAEEPVLPLSFHDNPTARCLASRILAKIGGSKSISNLRKAQRLDKTLLSREAAKNAIIEIGARMKGQSVSESETE